MCWDTGSVIRLGTEFGLKSLLLRLFQPLPEAAVDPDPTANSQSIIEETPGRNLMAASLAIPHSVTPNQGTHFTDKETWQEPWRVLAMGW